MFVDILLGMALGGLITAKLLDPSKLKEYHEKHVELLLGKLKAYQSLTDVYQERLEELEREVGCFIQHTDREEVLKCLQKNDPE